MATPYVQEYGTNQCQPYALKSTILRYCLQVDLYKQQVDNLKLRSSSIIVLEHQDCLFCIYCPQCMHGLFFLSLYFTFCNVWIFSLECLKTRLLRKRTLGTTGHWYQWKSQPCMVRDNITLKLHNVEATHTIFLPGINSGSFTRVIQLFMPL